ncbi:hypothetical protein AYL99_05438 [Fonsecaea erecta]|uniref:Uncharacterized protein n=1 Tax=Fonsecaea erecta TaxID=1367422 RepID=A0A178ZM16_9EURO|nr:hypothetical protein AYL99_05438 [Fonsecaea erecta]OAP60436.1 hypothetical protein AYL99_05438 [Fonsecaea erecta]
MEPPIGDNSISAIGSMHVADLSSSSNGGLNLSAAQYEMERGVAPTPGETESEDTEREKHKDDLALVARAEAETPKGQELYGLQPFLDADAAAPVVSDNAHHEDQSRVYRKPQHALSDESEVEELSPLDTFVQAAEAMCPLTDETISFLKDLRRLRRTLENTAKLSLPLRSFPFLNEETRRSLLAQSMTRHHAAIRLLGQKARDLKEAADRCSVIYRSVSSLEVRKSVNIDTLERFLEAVDMSNVCASINRRLGIEVQDFEIALKELRVHEHFVE